MERRTNLHKVMLICSLIVILLAACSPGAAPTPTRVPLSQEDQAIADHVDEFYTQLTQEGKFSGVVLIEYQGKIILDKGYGQSDRQSGTPNTIQTRFRLLNSSKPFTTLSTLMLIEQGKLDLADTICKYLDDCPAQWGAVTVESLLRGTSGLHDYTLVTPIKKTWDKPIARQDMMTLLRGVSMDAPFMGPSWEGASDYALLAFILERVSGETYPDFIKKSIIEPLGLTNTGFVQGQGEKDNLAIFYKGKDAEPTVPPIDMSNLVGFGSAYSSAEDLLTLAKAIQNGSLLSTDSTTRMLVPNEFWIGLGWLVYEFDGNTWITNSIGLSHARSQQATFSWTADGAWMQVILTNQQDVNTVKHPFTITCLPGKPLAGDSETWAGYSDCEP